MDAPTRAPAPLSEGRDAHHRRLQTPPPANRVLAGSRPAPTHRPGPGEIAVTVPLHPAETTRLDRWPGTIHTSRLIAAAIARAIPANSATGPTVLLLANPTTGMLTAIGPFDTAEATHAWLRHNGPAGSGITSTPLPLCTPHRPHHGAHR